MIVSPVRLVLAFFTVHARALEGQVAVRLVLVLHERVGAYNTALLQVSTAAEVARIVRTAAALVDSRLRIRAKRARSYRHRARGEDLFRRNTLLDPVHERTEQILRLRTYAPTAMPDARRTEQSIELLQLVEVGLSIFVAVAGCHLAVVVDDSPRHDELIVATHESEEFSALAPEGVQVTESVGHVRNVPGAVLRDLGIAVFGDG